MLDVDGLNTSGFKATTDDEICDFPKTESDDDVRSGDCSTIDYPDFNIKQQQKAWICAVCKRRIAAFDSLLT